MLILTYFLHNRVLYELKNARLIYLGNGQVLGYFVNKLFILFNLRMRKREREKGDFQDICKISIVNYNNEYIITWMLQQIFMYSSKTGTRSWLK